MPAGWLKKKENCGAGKLYAQGLASAAEKFSDKELNQDNLGELVQSLLGAEKTQQESKAQSGGLLESLLSGLSGQSGDAGSYQKIGLDELFRGGMAFYQSKQDGGSNMEAVMDAIKASSPMGQTLHRTQSASIVAPTFMKYAGNLSK